MSLKEHKKKAAKLKTLNFAVITISDTRTKENDHSGQEIMKLINKGNHKILYYGVIKDNLRSIQNEIKGLINNPDIQVIITNGGTGLSRRDTTPEAIMPLLDKKLEGFGELFRELSYKEIGAASMLSRACAGTIGEKIIFCLPGSLNAVKLACEKLILPEVRHLVWELKK